MRLNRQVVFYCDNELIYIHFIIAVFNYNLRESSASTLFCFPTINAEHITSRGININAIALWIVFCKYYSHRIESPYHSIIHRLQKSEAFQSVHHVTFILCYPVLYDFFVIVFALIRVRKH